MAIYCSMIRSANNVFLSEKMFVEAYFFKPLPLEYMRKQMYRLFQCYLSMSCWMIMWFESVVGTRINKKIGIIHGIQP